MASTSLQTSIASLGVSGAVVVIAMKVMAANHVTLDDDTIAALMVLVTTLFHVAAAYLGPKSPLAAVLEGSDPVAPGTTVSSGPTPAAAPPSTIVVSGPAIPDKPAA